MKICLVRHIGRDGTGPGSFLARSIANIGDVVDFYASAEAGALDDDKLLHKLVTNKFDRYVFWQTEHLLARILPLDLGPTFVMPKFGASVGWSAEFWRQFVKCHFIPFSRTQHELLQNLDIRTSYFQYFPNVADNAGPMIVSDQLDGLYVEGASLSGGDLGIVLKQCRLLNIRQLYIYAPKIAGTAVSANRVWDRVIDGIQVNHLGRIADSAEFDRIQRGPLFQFYAPTCEGGGISMLSAMARGQIVVAPDLPIFNEYISHRHSGLLYDPNGNFSDNFNGIGVVELARISENARAKITTGHRAWVDDQDRLCSIISCDGRRWPTRDRSAHFANSIRSSAHERASNGQ